jgi:peptidoglycan/LPS O-acetylase OafA/YrhL
MQNQALLLFLAACALVFVLASITFFIAKQRSRSFIRRIKALARGNEPAIRVKISRGGNQ